MCAYSLDKKVGEKAIAVTFESKTNVESIIDVEGRVEIAPNVKRS